MKKSMLILQVFVSGLILFFFYQKTPIENVLQALKLTVPAYLGIAILIMGANHLVLALRAKMLTDAQGFRITLMRILAINFASQFYKLIFPGGMLALVGARVYKLYRIERNAAGALWATFFDRLAATFGLGVVGIVFWFLDPKSENVIGGWLFFFILFAAGMSSIVLLNERAANTLSTLTGNLPWLSLSRKLNKFVEALAHFRDASRKQVLTFLTLVMVPHLFGVLLYWLLVEALGISLNVVTLGWMRSVVTLAIMVPVSIGGLGVRDGMLVLLFGLYGVAQESALAFAILAFLMTVLFPAIVGGLVELRAMASLGRRGPTVRRE